MWERDGVHTATSDLLAGVRVGRGRALFLIGNAGMGKTTCLDSSQEAAAQECRVARASGNAVETSLAFGLVAQLVGDLGGADSLFQGRETEPVAQARARTFFGVLRWLENLARQEPLWLSIDDLHWADQDSLALLGFLIRRIDKSPIGIIAGLRPWPPAVHDAALDLAHDNKAMIVRLAPLSRRAAGELLMALCGCDIGPPTLEQAWAVAEGNPLLIEQVALAINRGEPVPAPGLGRLTPQAEPLLLRRFVGLDPVVLRFAEAASILGLRFRTDLPRAVAGFGEREEQHAVQALVTSGLLRDVGPPAGGVEFVHPLFAQALYDSLAPTVRVSFHRRAFRILLDRGLEEEAAAHAVRGDLIGDRAAVDVLERTGRQALTAGALSTATRLLQAAVDLSISGGEASLKLTLAEVLLEAGRPRDAIDVAETLLDANHQITAPALQLLGNAHYVVGEHDLAARHFDRAVEAAEDEPGVAVAALLLHTVLLSLTNGPAAALVEVSRARTLSHRVSEPMRRRVEGTWGYVAVLSGDPSGYEASLAGARLLLEHPRDAISQSGSREITMYGATAKYLEHFAVATDIYQNALSFTTASESPGVVAVLSTGLSETLVRSGRLAEALAASEQACDVVEAASHVTATLATVGMAHVLLLIGRHDESDLWCERAEKMARQGRVAWLPLLRVWDLRAQRYLRDGDPAQASALYLQAMDLAEQIGLGEPCVVPWAGHAVKAHAAVGELGDAERVLAWLDRCCERLPCRWPRIASAAGRALLADRAGDHDRAEAQFRTALALVADADLPLDRIETLLEWGAFLRRRGRLSEARPILADAFGRAEACGAAWLAARGAAEFSLAGGRRRRTRDGKTLTSAEERVAELAARGLTNREIANQLWVSVNTVETHLRHIYAKLGIGSRRELSRSRDFSAREPT